MTNHLSPLFAELWSTISRPRQIDLSAPVEFIENSIEPVTRAQLEAAMRLAYVAGRNSVLTDECVATLSEAADIVSENAGEYAREQEIGALADKLRALAGKDGE